MRKIIRAVFLYLLITSLIWIFAISYSNSYNRIHFEKINPASVIINGSEVKITVLHEDFNINFEFAEPESRFYYILYSVSPDSLRFAESLLIEAVGSLF